MTARDTTLSDRVESAVAAHGQRLGALMPVLHEIQEQMGYIPGEAVPLVAGALNLSRAEVQGVIGFYHDFRSEPAGRHTVHICRAEACQAMGSVQLESRAKLRLGIDYGETTPDGRFSLEPVYCLGNCACSPSISVGNRLHARVTPERFDEIIAELESTE